MHIPLREVFVTSNVSTFAVVTALAGLGVTMEIALASDIKLEWESSTNLRRGGPPPGPAIFSKVELLSIKQGRKLTTFHVRYAQIFCTLLECRQVGDIRELIKAR